RQSNVIFLSHQEPGALMFYCFGDSTMTRRNAGQPSRHCFQDRVRHTFLVLIPGYFAGMQKQMRTRIKLKQFPLREKPNEMYIFKNPQSVGKHLQFRLERSFASDEKFRFGIVFLKNRKSAQARRNTLFRNQPARLYDSPFSVARWLSIHEWKFSERDTSAIDSQFFRRAAQADQSVNQ